MQSNAFILILMITMVLVPLASSGKAQAVVFQMALGRAAKVHVQPTVRAVKAVR
jgi:hypothetical protein